MGWWVRAIMIDENTGMVFTTNQDPRDKERHFIKYDPSKNRFSQLDAHVPPETVTASKGQKAGGYNHMRSQTRRVGPDGLFRCITYGGQLFTFDPVKEEVVDRGRNWPGKETYTCSMDRSPGR